MFLEELRDARLYPPALGHPLHLGLDDMVRELSRAKSSPSRELQIVERKRPSSRVSQLLAVVLAYVADASHRGMKTLDKAMFAGKTLATTSKLAAPWLLLHGLQAAVGEPHKAAAHLPSRLSSSRLSIHRLQNLRGRNELSRSFSLRSKGTPSAVTPLRQALPVPGFAGNTGKLLIAGFQLARWSTGSTFLQWG